MLANANTAPGEFSRAPFHQVAVFQSLQRTDLGAEQIGFLSLGCLAFWRPPSLSTPRSSPSTAGGREATQQGGCFFSLSILKIEKRHERHGRNELVAVLPLFPLTDNHARIILPAFWDTATCWIFLGVKSHTISRAAWQWQNFRLGDQKSGFCVKLWAYCVRWGSWIRFQGPLLLLLFSR